MVQLNALRLPLASVVAAGLMTGLVASAASAQQPTSAQQAAIRSACQSDYRAHCSSVPSGGSAALQCLQQNVASLSAGCQSAVNAVGGAAAAPAAAAPAAAPAATPAQPAAKAAPAPTAPAPAKPAAAAPAPIPQLTPRQEAALIRQSCRRDFRTFCSNVVIGAGNVAACLSANRASLSAGCKSALASLAR